MSSQRRFKTYFLWSKNIFLQNEYIFQKDLYFICNTNIFCVKIYFWNEINIFYIFIYIFLCKKSFFSVKSFFIIKHFFNIKTFFSANNVYFVKKKYFFKKKFFFNLVLRQMNNHSQVNKQVVLFTETAGWKVYLSLTRPYSRMCIRIYIFNFIKPQTNNNKNKTKKSKEKRISPENRLKKVNLRPPGWRFF